tara:strand:+ start:67 stop:231 length:165 start_codon:yes stop_codon:yes gene_type:complete
MYGETYVVIGKMDDGYLLNSTVNGHDIHEAIEKAYEWASQYDSMIIVSVTKQDM